MGLSVLRFSLFFRLVFAPKDFAFLVLVLIAVCGFSLFRIWFSVFVKNTSGFSVLVSDVGFGFSYCPIWVPVSLLERCSPYA